ncbi:hypothetical protein C0J52_05031 [Blattella germanica]|nr:hypothetical protein C0J52_05031 [Blattella germanica]
MEVTEYRLEGSHRRIDMIAIPPSSAGSSVIDSTIRTESYEDQPRDVHEEKCNIYVPTIPFYKDKFNLTSIEVIGLMVGARGTIPHLFVCFCRKFDLPSGLIMAVVIAVVKVAIVSKISKNRGRGGHGEDPPPEGTSIILQMELETTKLAIEMRRYSDYNRLQCRLKERELN